MKKILPLLIIVACTSQQATLPETTTTTTTVQEITTTTQAAIEYDRTLEEVVEFSEECPGTQVRPETDPLDLQDNWECGLNYGYEKLAEIDGEYCIIYENEYFDCYQDKQEFEEKLSFERDIYHYKSIWELSYLVSYSELTEEEYDITLQLYEDFQSYEWNQGYNFTTIIEIQELESTISIGEDLVFLPDKLYNRDIIHNEILVPEPGREFYCKDMETGTSISAFANEFHPLYKGSELSYQISVKYVCTQNEQEYLYLFGPIFYQNNQWWGYIYYDENYLKLYRERVGEIDLFGFMSRFVKRIPLGDISISK